MARKVFFSFHFQEDHWRAGQVRNIGTIEGSKPLQDNDWEQLKRRGDYAIKNWIDDQLRGTSCVVVLIGNQTATRKWIQYEIRKGWELGKGVMGIYIHKLLNQFQMSTYGGSSPFNQIYVSTRWGAIDLGRIVPLHDPPYYESTLAYRYIEANIETWVEEAIKLRGSY